MGGSIMIDSPRGAELIGAVKRFLEKELLPSLADPRLKYQTLIAVNALAMTLRDHGEVGQLRADWRILTGEVAIPAMLDFETEVPRLEVELCRAIARGDYDDSEHRLRGILRCLTV